MKEYVNNAYIIRILILPLNIILLGLTIIRWINYKGEDTLGCVSMSVVFVTVCILFDLMFIYLKSLMYSTKFDGEKIEQQYFFNKKTILYKEIKTVLLIGTVVVLCDNIVDVSKLPKKGNILRRCLNDKVMFYLGNDDFILNIISENVDCDVYIINSTPNSKSRFEKYFHIT